MQSQFFSTGELDSTHFRASPFLLSNSVSYLSGRTCKWLAYTHFFFQMLKQSPSPKMILSRSQIMSVVAAVCIIFILFRSWGLSSPAAFYYPDVSQSPTPSSNRPTTVVDEIPKKIWYKLGSKGLSEDAIAWTGSCIHKNPGYAVEFMTDETADAWVAETFARMSQSFPSVTRLSERLK